MMRTEDVHRVRRPPAESIVAEVNGVEFGEGEKRGAEGAEGLRDFRDEATSEDVGEIGDLSTA
jgi:hypothetical protein